ncbi:hypothetical protein [Mangrovibacterium marinum]|uniref:Uncharacterized protein n=1 Tax=Mangrovibacterium marinum TaxID=1639118 RepID=A0A2T5C1Y4_9BACT|nr:hypothetical protein [Mangrovibacterium marinum]PTN08676.1 hypothetical protein C8N47_10731 [Mangrovibacterium marinum]
MKKRDYYILAFLACLVVYAMLNRRSFAESNAQQPNKLESQNAANSAASPDSLQTIPLKVNKAEI